MKTKNRYCVILAGGKGNGLWPISREAHPKQFQDIMKIGRSLIQQAFDRVSSLFFIENIFVITYVQYKELVYEQLPKIRRENVLIEPMMMNTSASIAYASFKIHSLDQEALIFTVPSDHFIELKGGDFYDSIEMGFTAASSYEDALITIGVEPDYAETSYGYIQYVPLEGHKEDFCELKKNLIEIKKVKTFVEKPPIELAESFLASGEFLWNSGMFIWKSQSILRALKKHLGDIYDIFSEGVSNFFTLEEEKFIEKIFPTLKKISIDYGVLEKSNHVYVITSHFKWMDVGCWSMIWKETKKDNLNNALFTEKILLYQSKRNIIYSNVDKKLMIIQGLEDFVVVNTKDALFICKLEKEEEIKQYLNDLKVNEEEGFL